MDCEQTRQMAAELALGITDGADRAAALRHLAGCDECRRVVQELSEVTDELLLLAPEHEPPLGFESRTLARLRAPEAAGRPPRRRWAVLGAIAAAAAAAAVVAAIMAGAYGDDRRLADQYRETLAKAHGSYFEAGILRAPGGARAGVAYGYRGTPSWVFVVVDRSFARAGHTARLVMKSGREVPVAALRVTSTSPSAGRAIPVDLHQVRMIRLVGAPRGQVLTAVFPHARGG